MDMDFLDKMRDIHSFVKLQEIYESWVNEGVIEESVRVGVKLYFFDYLPFYILNERWCWARNCIS